MQHLPTNAPPEPLFVEPLFDGTAIELGYLEADDETVRRVAERFFRAFNPKVAFAHQKVALKSAAARGVARIKRLTRLFHAMDPFLSVIAAERICKSHLAIRAAGFLTLVFGIFLLSPIPLVISAGIEESLLIQRVVDQPLWGLAYGLAPIGAVLGTHGMHGALKSDRARRRFDLLLYGSAMAAFGYWAYLYGPTFLSDSLSGFGAVTDDTPTLSDFYFAHILAEVTGAAAAYTASMHMLTAGARKITVPNEARELLGTTIGNETNADLSLAQERDATEAQPALYDDALAAYQERCVIKVAVVRKLLATKSAADNLAALKELRAVLHANPIGGHYDV